MVSKKGKDGVEEKEEKEIAKILDKVEIRLTPNELDYYNNEEKKLKKYCKNKNKYGSL